MLEIAQKLCRNLSGSKCSAPHMSSWVLKDPSQSSISVDVADIGTGGAAAIAPANVKIYGSYFSTGLECHGPGGMSAFMSGYGAGAGAGAGWGIPFVGAKGVGKLPDGIKKKVLSAVGSAAQGKALDMLKSAAWGGISGGTRLVAGPDAGSGNLTFMDFHDAFVTIVGLGANFVVNGVSLGVVLIAKQRPVIRTEDMLYCKAIGLMAGVGLATSLDIEASGMVYRVALQ